MRAKGTAAFPVKTIDNWTTLSAALALSLQHLAWVHHDRDKMQHEIRLGKRTVYKSDEPLLRVQQRIALIVAPTMKNLPMDVQEAIVAYRENLCPGDLLKELAGTAQRLISFDIRKFYDHIQLPHIEKALADAGFASKGGRVIGKYCVVRRGDVCTLQQGSPASPAISNLVGARYLDKPILKWLHEHYPDLQCRYMRYCDNVQLFLYEPEPEGFGDAYKEYVHTLLQNGGFKAHDWASISKNNPHRNMKFLGVVLNKVARLEKCKIDSMRAMAFNMCIDGWEKSQKKFGRKTHIDKVMQGNIAYVRTVNEKHAMWLDKLFQASKALQRMNVNAQTRERLRNQIMGYKNASETVQEYVDRIVAAV